MRLFLCLLFLLPVFTHAQRSYKPEEINRLADLGRLWGILHYFHPAMADGSITTESLVVDNAASLANDPSAENFKRVVADMLGKLKDPFTRIVTGPANTPVTYNIFSSHPDSVTVHHLDNGVVYVGCPVSAMNARNLLEQKELSIGELAKSKGIIFDLRNRDGSYISGDIPFTEAFATKFLGSLLDEPGLNPVNDTYVQYDGFVSQMYRHGNIYSSGWKSTSDNFDFETDYTGPKLKAPVAFVVNGTYTTQMLALAQSLQYAGKCVIIYEGKDFEYPNKLVNGILLSDSLYVRSRTGYKTIGKNRLIPMPDKLINYVPADKSFMNECSRFLLSFNKISRDQLNANIDFIHPKLSKNNAFPASAGQRLLGLYNFWNAIEYFFPSKSLTGNNWDSILNAYIPIFINATDAFNYYLAICALSSEIHDSHARVVIPSPEKRLVVQEKFFYMPPVLLAFVEGKMHVIGTKKDSMSPELPVQLWDEIVKVNGIPTIEYSEKFRKYFSASNETGYYKQVAAAYLLGGEKNTNVQFTIKRGSKMLDVSLKRTLNNVFALPDTLVNLSANYPVSKIFPGNIGYINMRSINTQQVDSVMNSLWSTQAIVFDVRNYPRGTIWTLAPYLTDKPVVTQFNKYMLFNYRSISYPGNSRFEGNTPKVFPRMDKRKYQGKVVVLCNDFAQSHAEYSIMILQAAGKATVVGSQTMGADGNVSEIYFPGGYYTYFSALGVHYPDGTITQRKGVKIDIEIKTTLEGLKAGRDEVLERAIRFINTGK